MQDPEGGAVVGEFFIQGRISGPIAGDGRGENDPHGPLDNRMWFMYDLENGTFFMEVNESCWVGGIRCARAVEPDIKVTPLGSGNGIAISYEAVNSEIPFPPVSGTITLEFTPDGYVSATEDREGYPSLSVNHHRYGEIEPVLSSPQDWKYGGWLKAISKDDVSYALEYFRRAREGLERIWNVFE